MFDLFSIEEIEVGQNNISLPQPIKISISYTEYRDYTIANKLFNLLHEGDVLTQQAHQNNLCSNYTSRNNERMSQRFLLHCYH